MLGRNLRLINSNTTEGMFRNRQINSEPERLKQVERLEGSGGELLDKINTNIKD